VAAHLTTYIRHATRAEKHILKLDTARDRSPVAEDVVAVTVLDKSTGTFTLTFVFRDETELTLDDTEVVDGDVFSWDIKRLLLTNTAQTGLTLKLLVDHQLLKLV